MNPDVIRLDKEEIMAKQVIEYRCLLISPSDVEEERDALTKIVESWNAQIGNSLGARVDLVRWETHSTPDMGGEPQTVLNEQIVDDCDLGIALFWSRLGTATAEHESGSLEEIHRLLEHGAKVMVYLKTAPIPQERIDLAQFEKLQTAKSDLMKRGILGDFATIPELKEKVLLHLTSSIATFLSAGQGVTTTPPPPEVRSPPDVRVIASAAFAGIQGRGTLAVISIDVQNHSDQVVYLGTVLIMLKDKRSLFNGYDAVTGQPQTKQALNPGQKFSFTVGIRSLMDEGITAEELSHVTVSDDIGRRYDSDGDKLREIAQSLMDGESSR